MSTWPATLPKFRLPLNRRMQDGFLRTSMDAGPQKVRRRTRSTVTRYKFPLEMTGEQLDTLMTFYDETVEFNITSETGFPGTYRFTAPPSGAVRVGSSDKDERIWDVQIQIEKLP